MQKMKAKELVFCAAAIALAFMTSYIKIIKMPWGGSVTLCSMLFISLVGYWYGVKAGMLTGLAYGFLQFMQEPFVLSWFQVGCDYIFAFAMLGLSGFFSNSKNGLIKGYLLGALMRGAFHALGGYLYWMEYMPESFPKALEMVYPIVYNYSFIGTEVLLTAVILNVPAVKNAISQIGQAARS